MIFLVRTWELGCRLSNRTNLYGYLAVVVTSFLLGLFPTVSKPVIATTNPLFFTSICALAPFFVFTPLSITSSRRNKGKIQTPVKGRRIYGIVMISAFVGGIVGPVVYFFGLQTTAASDASLLANAEMVFTIVIASIAFREKLSRTGLLAVILVSIGVVVVTTNLQFSNSLFDFVSPGHLLILMSGLCWGLDNNIITYASERIDVVKFIQLRSSLTGQVPAVAVLSLLRLPAKRFRTRKDIPDRPARIRRISLLQLPGAEVAGRDQIDPDFPDILGIRADCRVHYPR